MTRRDPLQRFSPWFYAAALYNLIWGACFILAPGRLTRALDLERQSLVPWQVVGMLVLVYAPAYWWVARYPSRHPHLVAIALLGKLFGLSGFLWAALSGSLPLRFGLTILSNDLIWLPAFMLYLRAASRAAGGTRSFLAGNVSPPGGAP